MQALIKNGQLVPDDDWFIFGLDNNNPTTGRPLIPASQFLSQQQEWAESTSAIGVWLGEEDQPEALEAHLDRLEIIALHLPRFADGRAFSKARLLRQRYGYRGEIRVTGDFLPDQVGFFSRCGVNAFACRTEEEASIAMTLLSPFSVHYQTDAYHEALFERREG